MSPSVQQRDVTVISDLLRPQGQAAVPWTLWSQPGRSGVDVHDLYTTAQGASAFLARFAPGAHGDLHEHPDYELMFVLEGELRNDNGDRYRKGDLVLEEPESLHRVSSPDGCTLLVVRQAPTRAVR